MCCSPGGWVGGAVPRQSGDPCRVQPLLWLGDSEWWPPGGRRHAEGSGKENRGGAAVDTSQLGGGGLAPSLDVCPCFPFSMLHFYPVCTFQSWIYIIVLSPASNLTFITHHVLSPQQCYMLPINCPISLTSIILLLQPNSILIIAALQ